MYSSLLFFSLWHHPVAVQLLSRFSLLGLLIPSRNAGVVWKWHARKILWRRKRFGTNSNSCYCFKEAKNERYRCIFFLHDALFGSKSQYLWQLQHLPQSSHCKHGTAMHSSVQSKAFTYAAPQQPHCFACVRDERSTCKIVCADPIKLRVLHTFICLN